MWRCCAVVFLPKQTVLFRSIEKSQLRVMLYSTVNWTVLPIKICISTHSHSLMDILHYTAILQTTTLRCAHAFTTKWNEEKNKHRINSFLFYLLLFLFLLFVYTMLARIFLSLRERIVYVRSKNAGCTLMLRCYLVSTMSLHWPVVSSYVRCEHMNTYVCHNVTCYMCDVFFLIFLFIATHCFICSPILLHIYLQFHSFFILTLAFRMQKRCF